MPQMYYACYVTIAITAFLVNLLLCSIHACCKNVRKNCNIFFVSHYVANTVLSLATILYLFCPSIASILHCVVNISFSSSVLCVPVMALVTLSKSMWVNQYSIFTQSGKCRFLLLAILILVALVVALPPFAGWGSPVFQENPTGVSLSYSLFIGVILTVLPFAIICSVNCLLFKRVRTYQLHSRRAGSEIQRKSQFDQRRREGKTKWIMLLQIAAFVICLIPITLKNCLTSVLPGIIPDGVKYSFNCLALAFCLFSPLLHGFTNREICQACKCHCRPQKTFAFREKLTLKRADWREQIGEGCYRERTNRGFIVPLAELPCDQLTGAERLFGVDRERLVRFQGVSFVSGDFSLADGAGQSQRSKTATRDKRPITTEFAPVRRHSTKREYRDAPRRDGVIDTKVRFDGEHTDKKTKKYIATPSLKRMRRIKKWMLDISLEEFESSLASMTGSEFEFHQHVAPHFTNYIDPVRSAGLFQVLTGKRLRSRL